MSYSRLNAAMRSSQLYQDSVSVPVHVSSWMGLLGSLTFLCGQVLAHTEDNKISDTDVYFSLNQLYYGAELKYHNSGLVKGVIENFMNAVIAQCGMVTNITHAYETVPFTHSDPLHYIQTVKCNTRLFLNEKPDNYCNEIILWRVNTTDINQANEACLALAAHNSLGDDGGIGSHGMAFLSVMCVLAFGVCLGSAILIDNYTDTRRPAEQPENREQPEDPPVAESQSGAARRRRRHRHRHHVAADDIEMQSLPPANSQLEEGRSRLHI